MNAKKTTQRQGFKTQEFIVYPAHGVGQIVAIEEQEVAGARLEHDRCAHLLAHYLSELAPEWRAVEVLNHVRNTLQMTRQIASGDTTASQVRA